MRGLIVAAVLVLTACSSGPDPAVRSRFHSTIPTCASQAECDAKWEAAQIWVAKNAAYKLQTSTNVLLETYNSTDTDLSVRVLKEPNGRGGYTFTVSVWCGNPFGCFPDTWATAQNFNDTLNAVQAP